MAQMKERAQWNRPYASEVMDWSAEKGNSARAYTPRRSRSAYAQATTAGAAPALRPRAAQPSAGTRPAARAQDSRQSKAEQRQSQARLSATRVVFAMCVCLVLLAMIWMNLAQWGEASANGRQIATLQQRIETLREGNATLESEIDRAMSGEKVRNHAVNKLGMRLPSEEQTETITKEELRQFGVLVN